MGNCLQGGWQRGVLLNLHFQTLVLLTIQLQFTGFNYHCKLANSTCQPSHHSIYSFMFKHSWQFSWIVNVKNFFNYIHPYIQNSYMANRKKTQSFTCQFPIFQIVKMSGRLPMLLAEIWKYKCKKNSLTGPVFFQVLKYAGYSEIFTRCSDL